MTIPTGRHLDGIYRRVDTDGHGEGEADDVGMALRAVQPRVATEGAGWAGPKGVPEVQVSLLEHAAEREALIRERAGDRSSFHVGQPTLGVVVQSPEFSCRRWLRCKASPPPSTRSSWPMPTGRGAHPSLSTSAIGICPAG